MMFLSSPRGRRPLPERREPSRGVSRPLPGGRTGGLTLCAPTRGLRLVGVGAGADVAGRLAADSPRDSDTKLCVITAVFL